jgi:hypothetical protein
MKTSILIPLASSIAQLKWAWFRNKRNLVDVDTFDSALRGPLGAFLLIFRLRPWYYNPQYEYIT